MIHLPDFSNARILVVGDLMLDRYWHGDTRRISPEAPVPVVKVGEIEERIGGAGNVALNAAALGASVTVSGLLGKDEPGQTLTKVLSGNRVKTATHSVSDAPTITKLRVLSRHQQLIRLDFEETYSRQAASELLPAFEQALSECDVVVLSDYAKGTLQDPQPFIQAAQAQGKFIVVDPKRTDFEAYQGADLLTPNLGEFEAAAGSCADDDELVSKAQKLITASGIKGLLITRSEQGMSLVTAEDAAFHLPAKALEVFDVTGAGDTVVAVLAAAVAAGSSVRESAILANEAAGIVVGKLGTATVSAEELHRELVSERDIQQGVIAEDELVHRVARARARGEVVVMTNGCFDILHPGHVAYLEQARALGDRLIVAVNDDDSVKRLKGPKRPVNSLGQRMAVLAGLRSVDWVLPFTEDTPERLICKVLPDFLVKGGDYEPQQIAGYECIKANGGDVIVLDFLEGCSTTGMIETIKDIEST